MILQAARRISRFINFDKHLSEVIENAGHAFILMGVGLGLGFAINVVLARLLGAEGVGIYYIAFDVTNVAITLATLGLSKSVLRFVAAHAALGEWGTVRVVYRKSIWIVVGLSLMATFLLIALAPSIALNLYREPGLVTPLRLMSLIISPTTLLFIYIEALRGLKRIRESVFLGAVGIPLLSLPLIIILVRPLGISGAISARLLATSALSLFSILLWRRAVPHLPRLGGSFPTSKLLKTSFPFLSVDLVNLMMRRADALLLGIWASSELVGVYNVAIRVAVLTSFTLGAVNSIIAPKFAALYAQGDLVSLERLVRGTTRLLGFIATATAVPLLIFTPFVLQLFGAEFVTGTTALRILILGQFVNIAAGPVGFLLLMSGYEKIQQNNVIVSAALNILLNLWLIPKYGIIGAATAATISLSLKNLISIALVSRYMKIRAY
jgi:O-antigen/teichoic acid export membrane protein